MRGPRSHIRWIAASVALLFAAGAMAAGQGRRGSVKIKLLGANPPPKSIRNVVIISANTGEVLDSMTAGRRRQLVLRPTPGVLFAAATDVSARTVRSGISGLFLIDPEVASTASIRPRRAAAQTEAASARSAAAVGIPAAQPGGGGAIVTMGSIPITTQGIGQTGSIGAGLVTGAYSSTHDAGARWVSTDQKTVDFRHQEYDLQGQGRLDPSTPVRDETIAPNTRIEGEFTDVDGHLSGELRIIDLRTGEVIERIPIDRNFDRDSLEDLKKLLGDLSGEIIRIILERLGTTTTTSTTSTTTTTSTSTTTTTTLATTTTTTTTTTIPTTTTTSSTTTTTVVACGSGLLASAEVSHDVRAAAQASSQAMGLKQDVYPPAPATLLLGEAGGTGTRQYSLSATSGATATASGTVTWNVSPCEITASGTFREQSTGGTDTSNAQTGLDAGLQIKVRVKQQVPYTLTGQLRASGKGTTAAPLSAYLRCSSHFGFVDADLLNPTGSVVPFGEASALHPTDELIILCSVKRGGASTGAFGNDNAALDWSYTLTLGH